MQLSEQDELMLQRCVDDELSTAEARSLLMRLETIRGGWKALACGLLEDRMLRRSLRGITASSSRTSGGSDRLVTVKPAGVKARARSGWFAHPVTSLTLCAAIAFVSGLLVPTPGYRSGDRAAATAQAAPGSSGDAGHGTPGMVASNDTVHGGPAYQLQWYPEGSDRQVRIPVYKDADDWAMEMASRRPFPAAARGAGQSETGMRMIRVPMNDQEDILLWVKEQDLRVPLQ